VTVKISCLTEINRFSPSYSKTRRWHDGFKKWCICWKALQICCWWWC